MGIKTLSESDNQVVLWGDSDAHKIKKGLFLPCMRPCRKLVKEYTRRGRSGMSLISVGPGFLVRQSYGRIFPNPAAA